MDEKTKEAVERLVEIAEHDTGQSRRVADFLLSWWNADECGGFDISDLWPLDGEIQRDIIVTLIYIVAHQGHYADRFVGQKRMERLVRSWRPHLFPEAAPAELAKREVLP